MERKLTPRENQIHSLLLQGKKNREIAEDLGISIGTVKVHLRSLHHKNGGAAIRMGPIAKRRVVGLADVVLTILTTASNASQVLSALHEKVFGVPPLDPYAWAESVCRAIESEVVAAKTREAELRRVCDLSQD